MVSRPKPHVLTCGFFTPSRRDLPNTRVRRPRPQTAPFGAPAPTPPTFRPKIYSAPSAPTPEPSPDRSVGFPITCDSAIQFHLVAPTVPSYENHSPHSSRHLPTRPPNLGGRGKSPRPRQRYLAHRRAATHLPNRRPPHRRNCRRKRRRVSPPVRHDRSRRRARRAAIPRATGREVPRQNSAATRRRRASPRHRHLAKHHDSRDESHPCPEPCRHCRSSRAAKKSRPLPAPRHAPRRPPPKPHPNPANRSGTNRILRRPQRWPAPRAWR